MKKNLQFAKSDFFYSLPDNLIAQFPLAERTTSRLLILNAGSGTLKDRHFHQMEDFLQPGDLLVCNDTKVIPARLFGHKASGGKVEVFLEKLLSRFDVRVQIKASKAPKAGGLIHFENGGHAEVIGRTNGFFDLRFDADHPALETFHQWGHVPLPPYIKRDDQESDRNRYQTVYAERPGAVAAPTAGLHFCNDLLAKLRSRNVDLAFVTLHVGAGTFLPMRCQSIRDHHMHTEHFEVSDAVVQKIHATRKSGGRVVAVGTTTVRSLEAAAATGEIVASTGDTQLFITPGYQFTSIDAMITNFHLPESTLLMLVSAFGGYEQVMNAYQHAIRQEYRFFSYGDAMLIHR